MVQLMVGYRSQKVEGDTYISMGKFYGTETTSILTKFTGQFTSSGCFTVTTQECSSNDEVSYMGTNIGGGMFRFQLVQIGVAILHGVDI